MKQPKEKPRVICIGGGTGTFVTLRSLKDEKMHLSAIVSMSDSGGSNKRIRDEFGLLPTSDIRQCLVALSDENGGAGILRQLFMYRFEKGEGISGMTFGNLFMAALTDIVGSQKDAIKQTSKILRIHGSVIPVSFTQNTLVATYADGHVVHGEHEIDEPTHDGTLPITTLALTPEAPANPDALREIDQADCIIIGPGDLFTSILPNFLVKGIPEALTQTKARIIYVMNLMTKYGQTYNFTASDHIKTLERYIGRCIDDVIINNASIPSEALHVYEASKEYPVVDDLPKNDYYTVRRLDCISDHMVEKSQTDTLVRSLIRHDSEKLKHAFITIMEE